MQALLNALSFRGLRLLPQLDPGLPTYIQNSRHIIGTDHDRIRVRVPRLVPPAHPRARHHGRGPRHLCGCPRLPPALSQDQLQTMAKQFTKPYKRESFRLSTSTKLLGATARLRKTPEAWKAYNRAARLEHQQWQNTRVERACADWTLYREHHHRRKQQFVSTHGLASGHLEDPAHAVARHFEQCMYDPLSQMERELRRLASMMPGRSPPLTTSEVKAAVSKGRARKCPGPERVPNELLHYLANDDRGLLLLTDFYQKVFDDELFSEEWDHAMVSLLSKVECPDKPGDLRPIAVHSHVAKVFGRIILNRRLPPTCTFARKFLEAEEVTHLFEGSMVKVVPEFGSNWR